MKFQLVSDLHLEFGPFTIEHKCDNLILSGDICVAHTLWAPPGSSLWTKREWMMDFFAEANRKYKNVFYVMGNHEHYHGDYSNTLTSLREALKEYTNIRILDDEVLMHEGVRIIGGTLWTDMGRSDPQIMWTCERMMNDYGVHNGIGYGGKPLHLKPADTVMAHNHMVDLIMAELAKDNTTPTVIIGHHAPSFQSISEYYRRTVSQQRLNYAYATELSDIMLDNPCIKLWTHGHVHNVNDYMIGSTRVVSNPRGYVGYEETSNFEPEKVIEI